MLGLLDLVLEHPSAKFGALPRKPTSALWSGGGDLGGLAAKDFYWTPQWALYHSHVFVIIVQKPHGVRAPP